MGFIKPSRPQYDPSLDLKEEGSFLCQLIGIYDCDPDPNFPGSKNRLAFQFQVYCPEKPMLHLKQVASVVTASIYKDPKTGKRSNLLKLLTMMGVPAADKGCDPDKLIHRWFMVTTQIPEGKDKAYPISVTPATEPDTTRVKTKMQRDTIKDDNLNYDGDIPF